MDKRVEDLELRISDLERTVDKLRKKENKRTFSKILGIVIKLIIVIVAAIYLYKGYLWLNKNVITPVTSLKEEIDKMGGTLTDATGKITDTDLWKKLFPKEK